MLLAADNEEALCFTCHGGTGTGARTDVANGVQYRSPLTAAASPPFTRTGPLLGALRGGGFVEARIASSTPYRVVSSGTFREKVPVLATGQLVTSAHIALTENGLSMPGIAWGNGAANSGVGPPVTLSCASCHNPHGNNQYRILNPIPGDGSGPLAESSTANVVTDAALPPAGDARNYTVIAQPSPSFLLLASQVETAQTLNGYGDTAGDYFHRRVPWNATGNMDAPNGLPTSFNSQMSQWCTACHTRYYSTLGELDPSDDAIYKYQHHTSSDRACTTCHVAHGSNALMTADVQLGTAFSQNYAYPDDPTSPPAATTSASSRLLKIDRRGTCQACHDPTTTNPANSTSGPTPVPYVP